MLLTLVYARSFGSGGAPDTVAGMSSRALLFWDEAVTRYDFGPSHPMDPVRLALTMRLVRAFGLDRQVDVVAAPPAGDSTLRLVHRQDYVTRCGPRRRPAVPPTRSYGLGTRTTPPSPGCTRRPR